MILLKNHGTHAASAGMEKNGSGKKESPGAFAHGLFKYALSGFNQNRRVAQTLRPDQAGLPFSILRVMTHCCAMDRMLLTTQYSTSPAGKKKNMTEKMIGMNIITLA